MAWIESHQTLARHPKTLRLTTRLAVTKAQAVGHLHLLWWWTLDFAPDGDLSPYLATEIATAAEWTGDSDVFAAALREVGWIDPDGQIHDWHDYAGKLLTGRQLSRERMRRFRERGREQREAKERRIAPFLPGTEEGVKAGSDFPGEKEGSERGSESSAATVFESSWTDWTRHLAEAGRPITPTQQTALRAECTRQGHDRAIAVIRFSLLKGARNLIWTETPQTRRKPAAPAPNPPGWPAWLAEEYPKAQGTPYAAAPADVQKEFQTATRSSGPQ